MGRFGALGRLGVVLSVAAVLMAACSDSDDNEGTAADDGSTAASARETSAPPDGPYTASPWWPYLEAPGRRLAPRRVGRPHHGGGVAG